MRLTLTALRLAAFSCALGISLPALAQVTPSAVFANPQVVEWPGRVLGGAVRLYDINGNVIGGATHPMMVECPDGTVNCFSGGGGGAITGTVTANAGTNLNTSALALDATLGTTNTDLGAPGATACATDTSSCSVNQLIQRLAQRLTTLNTTVGTQSPGNGTNSSAWLVEQGCAGQTIGNTNFTPFDNNGAATTIKLVSKVSAKKVYICGFKVGPTAGAVNVALIEGTKVTNECDTGAKGLLNGATVARGDQLPANGGYIIGAGQGVIAATPDANNDVCIAFSGTAQTGGTLIWAQF